MRAYTVRRQPRLIGKLLTFDDLPEEAQQYLATNLGVSSSVTGVPYDRLIQGYMDLSRKLRKSLEVNDKALIQMKNEARRKSLMCELGLEEPSSAAEQENLTRIIYVVEVLLPERKEILDQFVSQWDALIWLEFGGVSPELRLSPEQQHIQRNATLDRVFAMTDQSTIELDEKMSREEARLLSQSYYSATGHRTQRERGRSQTRRRMSRARAPRRKRC